MASRNNAVTKKHCLLKILLESAACFAVLISAITGCGNNSSHASTFTFVSCDLQPSDQPSKLPFDLTEPRTGLFQIKSQDWVGVIEKHRDVADSKIVVNSILSSTSTAAIRAIEPQYNTHVGYKLTLAFRASMDGEPVFIMKYVKLKTTAVYIETKGGPSLFVWKDDTQSCVEVYVKSSVTVDCKILEEIVDSVVLVIGNA